MNELTNRGPLGSPPLPTGPRRSKRGWGHALPALCALGLLAAAGASNVARAAPPQLTCRIDAPSGGITITAGNSVDYSASYSGGSGRKTVSWTFQGGSPSSASGVDSATVLYDEPGGPYTTRLTVQTSKGETCTPTVEVTVNPAGTGNFPPVANDQTVTTGEDTPVAITLTGSDVDGDELTYTVVSGPANGTLSGTAPYLTYTPNANYSGEDTFTFLVNDNTVDSAPATVSITVTAVVVSQCTDSARNTLPDAHLYCTTPYTGPEVCVGCHEDEAHDMHGSVHYQQGGAFPNVTNVPGNFYAAGERPAHPATELVATGINTYCGTHENSPRFTCAGCHVGNGRFPKTPEQMSFPPSPFEFKDLSPEQQNELSNIDCLTCHMSDQAQYRRFPNWLNADGNLDLNLFEDLTLENVCLDDNGQLADPQVPGTTCVEGPPVVRSGLAGIPVVDPVTLDFEFAPAGGPGSLSFELPYEPPNTVPPDPAKASYAPMSVTTEWAVQHVGPTSRRSCLNCHAGAGGADGAKRGDLSTLLADPDLSLDQHMSSQGQGMTCSDCHSVPGDNGETHRLRGRGIDLRPNDVAERFTCESGGCHSSTPHDSTRLNRHMSKVACQTCHIPTYGKGIATETARDWEQPHLSQSACNGRGGWLPREYKGGEGADPTDVLNPAHTSPLVPTYAWFDGKSEVYYMGESLDGVPTIPLPADVALALGTDLDAVSLGVPLAILDDSGNIDMSVGANNPDAKIHPMKEHWGKLARNTEPNGPNTLIAHSTYDFFRTGDFDLAVQKGLEQDPTMEVTDDYTVVPVHTFQAINHGVEPRANALGAANQCGVCHSTPSLSGGPARMDLEGKLGYALRTDVQLPTGPSSNGTWTCAVSCHGGDDKSANFTYIHDIEKHRRRPCGDCHSEMPDR